MARGYTLIALVALAGCRKPDCLRGGNCAEATACYELYNDGCMNGTVAIEQRPDGSFVLENTFVQVVLDPLNEPHDLAPTGGNIVSFTPAGRPRNDLNIIYQLAGILPDDAFAYDSHEILDPSADMQVLVLRGTLAGRPDVEVATRYEIHACDQGVRVRSELRNRTADTQVFFVADAAHWGKRRALPFTPVADQGWVQPELDLIELEQSWGTFPYVAGRAADDQAPTYGFMRCDAARLEGVNDPEISALGTARTLVRPGEALVFERFLMATGGDFDHGIYALRQIYGEMHGWERGVRPMRGTLAENAALVINTRVNGQWVPEMAILEPGDFDNTVSITPLRIDVWSFGRIDRSIEIDAGIDDITFQEIGVPVPGLVTVSIADAGGPLHGTAVFTPADAAERDRLRGSYFGRFGDCAPWLGPPHGASPACNRALIPPGGTEIEVPAGRYVVYATTGLDHNLGRQELTVAEGESYALDFTLEPLDLRPPGRLWADLHVHGRASFDSSIPDADRVRSFVAAGVDVIAATDHDYTTDYAATVTAEGLDGQIAVMGGLETTQLVPWMDVPGDDFPRVIGHFNFWPLTPDPAAQRGGAPWDELIEAGELFDLMEPLVGADGLMMMNHPWDDTQFGRDLGYLRAINFDPRRAIPTEDNGTAQGMLVRRPGANHRNVDFDVIEVINGATPINYLTTRPLWFSLLSQGYVKPGAANSDSHGLTDAQLGYARTLVDAPTTVAAFDVAAFNGAIRDGKTLGVNGVLVLVTIGRTERTEPSLAPYVPVGEDWIDIEVRAPPWVPVTEVRLSTSAGTVVVAEGDDLSTPDDPFGTAGVVRIRRAIDLDEILPGGGDDWIVIEAGIPLPPSADLDDDGVPDTGDNNGDGEIDGNDIEAGEDSGPLESPADPTDPDDPRFVCTQVIPGMWPSSFAGPILIDQAGDGWDPPGISP